MAAIKEIVRGKVIPHTASTLAINPAIHHGRTIYLNATPITVTLNQATGSGARYRFVVGVAATATQTVIQVANATDVMKGVFYAATTTSDNAEAFIASATSDTISLNGTTKGGVVGDVVEIEDVASGVFVVTGFTAPTGTEATPFSAAVS